VRNLCLLSAALRGAAPYDTVTTNMAVILDIVRSPEFFGRNVSIVRCEGGNVPTALGLNRILFGIFHLI
jgi:hypothetical protein